MRHARLNLIAFGGALACFVAAVAGAQDKPADSMDSLREQLRNDKRAVVTSVLDLTESEGKAFWPVYNAYQSDMVANYDKLLKLIETYAKNYDSLSDETATSILKQYLALERDHVAILTAYLPRFQKVLPPKKVAKLYQIENKSRALRVARGSRW